MKRKLFILLFFLVTIFKTGLSQEIWTIGPMLHINLGGEKKRFSFAIEGSYWNLNHFFYGVDGGIEFEKNRIRIYSELQTGFGLAGIALGPLLEINTFQGKAHLGMQSSVWANYFVGVDYRRRWVDKTKYNCFGLYLKVPMAKSKSGSGSDPFDGGSNHSYDDWD